MTAGQAWDRYRSCCLLGGTDDERKFAWDRWNRIDRVEFAEREHEEKRAKTKAVRG